jgi:hypothetical protein
LGALGVYGAGIFSVVKCSPARSGAAGGGTNGVAGSPDGVAIVTCPIPWGPLPRPVAHAAMRPTLASSATAPINDRRHRTLTRIATPSLLTRPDQSAARVGQRRGAGEDETVSSAITVGHDPQTVTAAYPTPTSDPPVGQMP